jgi:hypothetical protein
MQQRPPIASSLRQAVFCFLLSRILVFAVLFFALQADFVPTAGWERPEQSLVIQLSTDRLVQGLRQMWSSGDSHFYLGIARNGYDPANATREAMRNWVFFPLFPVLVRALSAVTGKILLSAVFLSHFAFFAGLFLLHRLALCNGSDKKEADRIVLFYALNPMSYIFSNPMTESLFFATLAAAFLALSCKRPLPSALSMLLTTACRPTGLLLLPAYGFACSKTFGWFRATLMTATASCGLLAYSLFLALRSGDALIFIHNQKYWDRNGNFLDLFTSFHPSLASTGWNFIWLNAAAATAALLATAVFLKQRRISEALFCGIPVAALLSSGTVLSCYRICMPLFPLWLLLGRWANTSARQQAITAAFALLLGLLTAGYALGLTTALV